MANSKRRMNLTTQVVTVNVGLSIQDARERFVSYHRAKKHSEATIQHYLDTFVDLERWMEEAKKPKIIGALTTTSLEHFSHWLDATPIRGVWRGSTKRSIVGLHGRMKDMRAFVRWAIDQQLLPPGVKVTMPKLPEAHFEVMSDEDLVAVFTCSYMIATGAQGVRNRALIGLVLDSGIRLGELLSLTPDKLYLDDRLAHVTGKGNKSRHVPFSAGTAEALAEWLDIRPAEFTTLFDLTVNGTRSLLNRIQRETGVHLYAHLLRHQSATMMVRDGMDPLTLRRILGHVKLETVQIYVNLNAKDLRAKHDTASPMDKVRQLVPNGRAKPKRKRLSLK